MTKTPRWMKSAIAASSTALPALPWARGTRRKPESLKVVTANPRAIAVH